DDDDLAELLVDVLLVQRAQEVRQVLAHPVARRHDREQRLVLLPEAGRSVALRRVARSPRPTVVHSSPRSIRVLLASGCRGRPGARGRTTGEPLLARQDNATPPRPGRGADDRGPGRRPVTSARACAAPAADRPGRALPGERG